LAFFVVIVCAFENVTAQSEKGLVSHWTFDEGSGKYALDDVSKIEDSVHYIFNTTQPPRDLVSRKGILKEALVFDGYSSFIERPKYALDKLTQGITISVWIAPRTFENGDGGKLSAIVNQQNKNKNQGFALGLFRHGRWSFQVGTGERWIEVWDEGNLVPRRSWSKLVATYDAPTATASLYLNGKLISEKSLFKNLPIQIADEPLVIGQHNQPELSDQHASFKLNMFNGLMDDLKIYDRALSSNEITDSYNIDLATHNNKIPQISYEEIKIDRRQFKDDPYRPQFHASPPGHWMNEPHAPFYYNGKYHINYQFNPTGPYWHQIHWGHWVSNDMVHWYDVPESIYPDNDTLAPDGIWSGSATYDQNGVPVLFYTFGNMSKKYNQGVAMATPEDIKDTDLVYWKKNMQATITQKPGQAMMAEFRDPFAWKDPDSPDKWYMLVGSGQRGPTVDHPEGTAWFYESTDLHNWKLKGEFYKANFKKYPEMAGIWELPVVLPIGRYLNGERKYLFMCSPVVNGLNIRYFTGKIDPEKSFFVPDSVQPQQMNYGDAGFTASSGMVDPKTGRVIMFTLSHGGKGAGWEGNMGLPVELSLDKDQDLVIRPIRELESLRKKMLVSLSGTTIELANAKLKKVTGDRMEIILEMDPMVSTRCGIKVRKSPKGEEQTLIFYDRLTKIFCVDGEKSTLDSALSMRYVGWMKAKNQGPLDLKGENLTLHIFLDKSMLEVYANNRKIITTRTYPSLKESTGLELFSKGPVAVKSMEAWDLNSIYYPN
jgi:beta-fructofuranosidase